MLVPHSYNLAGVGGAVLPVKGYRVGKVFGVHKVDGTDGEWTVTLLASGYRMTGFDLRDQAVRYARLMAKTDADWTNPNVLTKENRSELSAHHRRCQEEATR